MNLHLRALLRPGSLVALLGIAMLLVQGVVAAEEADTLGERLSSLAAASGGALLYEETRESALLSRPVTYRGRLTHDPATGALTKWVDEPRPARLTLQDSQLEAQMGDGRIRQLPLDNRPDLAALLSALRAVMSGDVSSLEASFKADYLEGEDEAWLLQLRPRDSALTESLTLIEVRGQGASLVKIDTILGDGKRQSLRIIQNEETLDDD